MILLECIRKEKVEWKQVISIIADFEYNHKKRGLRQLALFFLSYYYYSKRTKIPLSHFDVVLPFHYGRMTREMPPTAKFILFCFPFYLPSGLRTKEKECPKPIAIIKESLVTIMIWSIIIILNIIVIIMCDSEKLNQGYFRWRRVATKSDDTMFKVLLQTTRVTGIVLLLFVLHC